MRNPFYVGRAVHVPYALDVEWMDKARQKAAAIQAGLSVASGRLIKSPIHLRNGHYRLAEIKLGGDKLIEEGVRTLKAVADKIDTTKMKAPAFLMVLTGTSPYAYRRDDGVYVVPITALKN